MKTNMKKANVFDIDSLIIDRERLTYNEYIRRLYLLRYNNLTKKINKLCLGKKQK